MRLNGPLLWSMALRQWSFLLCVIITVAVTSSCSKDIDIDIPEGAKQVVVEGTI